jgi:subtilase family serine protease
VVGKLGFASASLVAAWLFLVPSASPQVDGSGRAVLVGNVRPEARPENDRGRVPDALPLEHLLLQLKRPAEQERSLEETLDELGSKDSPNFHHWLTAEEFGSRFGPDPASLQAITDWLRAEGFRVNVVYPSGMVIDFSGTAGQVRRAFQTEIHQLAVSGRLHLANMSEPRIPAAFAATVSGVVSLHDFRPHTLNQLRKPHPEFTFTDIYGDLNYALVPADLATIYNFHPLFNSGISGQGQSITLIEDTDVFSQADWTTFRNVLGLSAYPGGSFSSLHPAPASGTNNCKAPGVVAPNDAEAIIDAEWASAAAPSAAIQMAACADTSTTFGGLIALENLINSSAPPAIVSISYGECEAENGASANAAYFSAYQQAAAEGISVFVAAGDSGAAGCDNSAAEATHGIAVSAFASTPYNVAVGGTDFGDTVAGTNPSYWSSTNTPAFGSALSYIPEIPWNDSCASQFVSDYFGYSPTYGPTSLCNDPLIGSLLMSTVAGGGGPSACATGGPATPGVVGGSCAGWPKPAWQSVFGNPSDGVRDTPDLSLFAADGLWSHFYIFCWSDTANGGATCGSDPSAWSGAGGTSFASPIMAGIQALINQKAGGLQGNPAPVYYQLAAAEYGATGSASCNSSNGASASAACIFYDVTQGDMDVDCGGPGCYLDGAAVGVLSTSNNAFASAYSASTGWDFATGIGSVNATNLVNNWPATAPPQGSFTLTASSGAASVGEGTTGAATTITINAQNGFTGSVSLSCSGLPSGVSANFHPASTTSSSSLTFTATGSAAVGTFSVTVAGVSGSLASSTTLSLTVTAAPNFALSASPTSLSIARGAKGTTTITLTPSNGFAQSVTLSASGLRSGTSAVFSPNPATKTTTLTLAAGTRANVGTVTVTITGKSGGLTHSTTISVTVHR